jgi:hypothetical protein
VVGFYRVGCLGRYDSLAEDYLWLSACFF